jgi:hypothetical protein
MQQDLQLALPGQIHDKNRMMISVQLDNLLSG